MENVGGIEKWEGRRVLVFSHMFLVERMEKQRNGKLFCLVEKKNEMIKNRIGRNLLLCKYQIKTKGNTLYFY